MTLVINASVQVIGLFTAMLTSLVPRLLRLILTIPLVNTLFLVPSAVYTELSLSKLSTF